MTTLVPASPLVGVKLLMTGTSTVKLAALVPVPLGVVTLREPVVAPAGTLTVIWVSELTTKPEAAVPLKRTADACKKLVPVITTLAPNSPLVGVKLLMTGGASRKLVALVPVPRALVTLMGPLVAPAGTGTVIWLLELTTKPGADTPLKATAVVPVKFRPVMTTLVPLVPLVGVKLVRLGTPRKQLMVAAKAGVNGELAGCLRLSFSVSWPLGLVAVTGPAILEEEVYEIVTGELVSGPS